MCPLRLVNLTVRLLTCPQDFFISVLEASATKRDAKAYLQTFGGPGVDGVKSRSANVLHDGIAAVRETPRFFQGTEKERVEEADEVPHVAIVKFMNPQLWDDDVLDGVAKTLTQLRTLGLLSVIVVDCDLNGQRSYSWRKVITHQTDRIARAIGQHGMPGAKVVDSAISVSPNHSANLSSTTSSRLFVESESAITAPLRSDHLIIVPSKAVSPGQIDSLADSHDVVLALAKFLSGLQVSDPATRDGSDEEAGVQHQHTRRALVDRIIVLDPIGGTPTKKLLDGAHVFINLEDEYETAKAELDHVVSLNPGDQSLHPTKRRHSENLRLAKDCLSVLPSTSSAVITSPVEAANLASITDGDAEAGVAGFVGSVGTRRKQNPLIHNLLTDRPIYSSSLPLGRIKPKVQGTEARIPRMPTTTLAKKGLPVTIFPDARKAPWLPPRPGTPRLRLTDTCVDLPRLICLIEDSFNRKLDAKHYLERVENSLAGIIIAGEYEGGAILTWERPFGMDEETAYKTGRMVPYLDKFAVLKRCQGAGGVADIVFNAMVRDCFPDGVCWRSRTNNPVNKWYFERSRGSWKLDESNWAMFWTTPDAALDAQKIRDYEDVCRNVIPSWADKQKAAD